MRGGGGKEEGKWRMRRVRKEEGRWRGGRGEVEDEKGERRRRMCRVMQKYVAHRGQEQMC